MSTLLEIVESALTEHELHYYTRTNETGGVVYLDMGGETIVIEANEEGEYVRIRCCLSLTLKDEAKLQQAYQMVNAWNKERITKYYMDRDGDLIIEKLIDTDDGMFNDAIFHAGFGRVVAALREAKGPMMKLSFC